MQIYLRKPVLRKVGTPSATSPVELVLAAQLEAIMDYENMNQSQLAAVAGISKGQMTRVMRGEYLLPTHALVNISEHLGYPVSMLLGR